MVSSHNPYFSGNLFAIETSDMFKTAEFCHNPYFSGNLFAIYEKEFKTFEEGKSQSLF